MTEYADALVDMACLSRKYMEPRHVTRWVSTASGRVHDWRRESSGVGYLTYERIPSEMMHEYPLEYIAHRETRPGLGWSKGHERSSAMGSIDLQDSTVGLGHSRYLSSSTLYAMPKLSRPLTVCSLQLVRDLSDYRQDSLRIPPMPLSRP